ncbi:MAG TPA: copper resistance protein B [Micavibrio sp.]|jgi:copper resistance protein B
MRTKILTASLLPLLFVHPALAMEDMKSEHGGGIFHRFLLETDYGVGNDPIATWDFDGWIGGDDDKLWLKSEGENADGHLEQAELWAMYSRNISTFWDAQVGIRHDFKPKGINYLTLGFDGLAPYFFETEAHLFISDEGDVTARVREENDFLLTQKLILQPYAEINLSAQDVEEQDMGAGLTDGEIGLQTRYEITRKFAPYIDVRYERKFGETSSIAERNDEDNDDFIGSIGLRLMF